jgi:hypothetical protein
MLRVGFEGRRVRLEDMNSRTTTASRAAETAGPAAPSLHVPLLVASFGYLIAVVLAWTTVRGASRRPASG